MASIALHEEEQREPGIRGLLWLVLGLILGGVALYAAAGPPRLPAELPSWATISATLQGSYLAPEVVAYALTTAAWAMWLWMVGTLVLRVVVGVADALAHGAAWVRALRAVSDRVTLPIVRKVVDGALVALLVVNLVGRSPAVVAAAPPEPTASALVATPNGAAPHAAALAVQSAEQEETVEYTVQAGDSLWAIAERFFGAGDRWPDLFAANKHRLQPDGRRLEDERRIHPGWTLHVPVPNPAMGAEDGTLHYVVRPGDTLRGIAARLLGDENRWPEVFELNRGTAGLPDGRVLTNPDVIWPDLRLRMPLPAQDGAAQAAPAVQHAPEPPSPPPVEPSPATPPEPTPGPPEPTHAPASPMPLATAAAPTAVAIEPASAPAPAAVADAEPGARDGLSPEVVLGVAGAAAAAGSAVYFARRRVRRSLSEPPVPPPPEPSAPAGDDFAEAEPARTLAHRLHGDHVEPAVLVTERARRFLDEQGLSDASVVAVYQARSTLTLLLDAPPLDQPRLLEQAALFGARLGATGQSAVTPGRDVVWRVSGLKAGSLLAPPDSSALPPLVALGLASADETLFVDWSAVGHVLVAGLPGGGTDVVLTSVVASLAARVRPDELHLWTVAAPQTLPASLARLPHQGQAFVRPDDDPQVDAVLHMLRSEVAERLQTAAERGSERWRPTASEPEHVLVVGELAALGDDGTTLELLGTHGPSVGVRLLAATAQAQAFGEDVLGHFGTRLVLQTLDDGESVRLLGRPDAVDLGAGELLVRLDGRSPVPLRGFRVSEKHVGELVRVMRDAYPRASLAPRPALIDAGAPEGAVPDVAQEGPAAAERDSSPDQPAGEVEAAQPLLAATPDDQPPEPSAEPERMPLLSIDIAAAGAGDAGADSGDDHAPLAESPVPANGVAESVNGSVEHRDIPVTVAAVSAPITNGHDRTVSLNGHASAVGSSGAVEVLGPPADEISAAEDALLQIHCLGGFEVRSGERELKPVGEEGASYKAWEVLAFLAAQPDGMAPKEKVLGAVWPEIDEERGANRLRAAMVRLRGILTRQIPGLGPDVVRCDRAGTCRLDTAVIWCDAQRFWALCTAARTLPPDEGREVLEEAVALYRGELLSGRSTRFYDWVDEHGGSGVSLRDRYHDLYCWATQRLARLYRRQGRPERAVGLYKNLLKAEPTLEDVVRELYRCYAEMGDLNALIGEDRHLREALRKAYHDPKDRDDDPDGYPPEPETVELFNRLRAELEARAAGAEKIGAVAER